MLIMGGGAGGYIVTNLVFMVEAVKLARSRLLIAALNGFPIGMCATAVAAYLSQRWLYYHVFVAFAALAFAIVLYLISFESVLWLANRDPSQVDIIKEKVAARNTCCRHSEPQEKREEEARVPLAANTKVADCRPQRTYGYLDLLKSKKIAVPLFATFYCFAVTSFVAFFGYFHVSFLPGDRYVNLFSLGLVKTGLGTIPFICDYCLGRRAMTLVSIGVAAALSWTLVFLVSQPDLAKSIIVSVLSIALTSALDPTWKMLHLLSAELFPTHVRNMARGVCQVGARLGGVLAPSLLGLNSRHPMATMALCSVLLTAAFATAYGVFPETRQKSLAENEEEPQVEMVTKKEAVTSAKP